MSFSLDECTQVVAELQRVVSGGRVQKIHQPHPSCLTLEVRAPGNSCIIFIETESPFARLHLTQKKFAHPPSPPAFCQFLRSHVEGGGIVEISQQPEDRIVYFRIIKANKQVSMVCSLIGNWANVLILDEKGVILRSLKESRMKVGEMYVPPERRVKKSVPTKDPVRPEDPEASLPEKTSENIERNDFSRLYPISFLIETDYSQREEESRQDLRHAQQLAHARKVLKQGKVKLQGLQEDLKKAEKYREYSRYGELLKGNLNSFRKGQESVTVTDYFDSSLPSITLPLDPLKDPVRNMEMYFNKYHKYLGAQEHLVPRIDAQTKAVRKLEQQLMNIERGEISPEVPRSKVGPKISPSPPSHPKKPRSGPSLGYRSYTSGDGIPILVGKTAKDNDHLTFKIGKPDDLWLHARGCPGSHVIVRAPKGAMVPHETLKDAATLTLWFSDLRKSRKGEVIYTFRKFVKKAKGQKAGSVQVTREKALWIEIQEDRLKRLKGEVE